MSSLSTPTAVVLRGAYSEESRKIPVLGFFEHIHLYIDGREKSSRYEDLWTEDFECDTTQGEHMTHDGDYHDDHTLLRVVDSTLR